MEKYEVPSTPKNYTVWYAYVVNGNPELVRTIDVLISNKQEFTEKQNNQLFDRFFGYTEEGMVLQQTGQKFEEQLEDVLAFLANASGDVTNFNESLRSNLGDLANSKGLEGIRSVVKSLVDETRKMQKSNQALQEKLRTSSQEIEQLRRNLEDVQREALTDPLTGINNRKSFDGHLRHNAMMAMEDGTPLCLAMIDIDHFKRFNDTYGHVTGDQVLKLVANILKDNLKGRDVPARYGGEEFAIVFPHTELHQAKHVAEHIRNAVSSKRLRNRQTGMEMGSITLSVGLAEFRPGEPLTDLIERADAALYKAKNEGRNRVLLETEL